MNELYYSKTYDYFLNRIRNNDHFRYSRINDGEIIAAIGKSPNRKNCDGHIYFPEMGKQLKDILLNYKYSEDYMLMTFDFFYNQITIKEFIDNIKTQNPDLKLLKNDFIRTSHEENPDVFFELLDIIKEKNVVIVGPDYLKSLDKFFNFRFIRVPIKNCYNEIDRIISDVKNISDIESDVFFLFSSSIPTSIIIDKIDDNKNTYLDWGSVWDTFFVSNKYNFIKKRSTIKDKKYSHIYKKYLL